MNKTWGMVVYRVKKSKVLIELISEEDRDLELSRSSLEFFFRIHTWLKPLRELTVLQYFWRPSFAMDRIFVNIMDNSFVEHAIEPAMHRCLYGILWGLGIQYIQGKSSHLLFNGISWYNDLHTKTIFFEALSVGSTYWTLRYDRHNQPFNL